MSIIKNKERLGNQKQQAVKSIIDEYEKIDQWIATELHDNIGVSISAIKLNIENIHENITKIDLKKYNYLNDELLNEIKNLTEVYNDIRNLSHNLVPVSFDKQIFSRLLEDKISNRFPNTINLIFKHINEQLITSDNNLKFNVYRILQNLSSNIIIHSKAKNARFDIVGYKDYLTISAVDDGIGFDSKLKNNGIGLDLIRKRVLLFDGTLEIDSQKGNGTTINITLPYKNQNT